MHLLATACPFMTSLGILWRHMFLIALIKEAMGLLTDIWNCGLCMRRECRERSRHSRRMRNRQFYVSGERLMVGYCIISLGNASWSCPSPSRRLPWDDKFILSRGQGQYNESFVPRNVFFLPSLPSAVNCMEYCASCNPDGTCIECIAGTTYTNGKCVAGMVNSGRTQKVYKIDMEIYPQIVNNCSV